MERSSMYYIEAAEEESVVHEYVYIALWLVEHVFVHARLCC